MRKRRWTALAGMDQKAQKIDVTLWSGIFILREYIVITEQEVVDLRGIQHCITIQRVFPLNQVLVLEGRDKSL
jgi:hypothetical protein